jgi:hypothetical protein
MTVDIFFWSFIIVDKVMAALDRVAVALLRCAQLGQHAQYAGAPPVEGTLTTRRPILIAGAVQGKRRRNAMGRTCYFRAGWVKLEEGARHGASGT